MGRLLVERRMTIWSETYILFHKGLHDRACIPLVMRKVTIGSNPSQISKLQIWALSTRRLTKPRPVYLLGRATPGSPRSINMSRRPSLRAVNQWVSEHGPLSRKLGFLAVTCHTSRSRLSLYTTAWWQSSFFHQRYVIDSLSHTDTSFHELPIPRKVVKHSMSNQIPLWESNGIELGGPCHRQDLS